MHDVGMERDVRFAADVRDIDAGPPSIHQNTVRFTKDGAEKVTIFGEREVFVILLGDIVRRRGDHQVDACVGELLHDFAACAKDTVEIFVRHGMFLADRTPEVRPVLIQPAVIEQGGIVTDPAGGAET